jgi:hypothetical protein
LCGESAFGGEKLYRRRRTGIFAGHVPARFDPGVAKITTEEFLRFGPGAHSREKIAGFLRKKGLFLISRTKKSSQPFFALGKGLIHFERYTCRTIELEWSESSCNAAKALEISMRYSANIAM